MNKSERRESISPFTRISRYCRITDDVDDDDDDDDNGDIR